MRNGARALTLVLLCATSDLDVAHVVSSPATPGQPSSLVRLAGLTGPGFRAVVRAPADWVDPFVGTYGRGGTFPGATLPWGMVSASPHTGDVAGGYRHGEPIIGFGQVHFSGSPPVLGLALLRVSTGPFHLAPRPSRVANEIAQPGYYAADLLDEGARVEATATARTTLYRVTFNDAPGEKYVAFDASHALGLRPRERALGRIVRASPTRIEGWSQAGAIGGLGARPIAYFVAEVNTSAAASGEWRADHVAGAPSARAQLTGAWWRVAAKGPATLLVRVGISYVDLDGARRNLAAEQHDWDFDAVRTSALQEWNSTLGRVAVDGGTPAEQRMFYTALYHALLHPSVFSDVDGRYRRYLTGDVGQLPAGEIRYSGFSLWDTFRTVHPLLAVAYPERSRAMIGSLLAMQQESGWLPQWELAATDGNAMVGDAAAVVVTDAYLKGAATSDITGALDALVHNATHEPAWDPRRPGNKGRIGLGSYERLGYVAEPPRQSMVVRLRSTIRALRQRVAGEFSGEGYENAALYGSVSTTQEYAYADACIARLAGRAGRSDLAAVFAKRSRASRALYDRTARWPIGDSLRGAFRPRLASGAWAYPLNLAVPHAGPRPEVPGFVEGDEWSYMFNVAHDVPWMVAAAGSPGALRARLDAYFDAGAFDLSNEPAIGYPYLYAASGSPRETQERVRRLLQTELLSRPTDLPGDDDAGTLSAWIVWSALGLYPYDPCSPDLVLGSPTFRRAIIRDALGRTVFTITRDDSTDRRWHVRAAALDGRPLDLPRVSAAALSGGATLHFVMEGGPVR